MSGPAHIYSKEYYERLKAIEGHHWWVLGMTDIMAAILGPRVPEQADLGFLDVGCGSGIGLAWAARTWPRARRVGVDVSSYALEHCRGLGAELHETDGAHLPVEDAAIDVAVCLDVLQHVENERPLLEEVLRVLRPGGWLFVRTNARGLQAAPPGSKLYTRRRLMEQLAAVGLDVMLCSPVNFLGSLVAAAKNWRAPTGGHGHHAAFKGGGYGGGLNLQPEASDRVVSRAKRTLLRLEGRWVRRGWRLPLGHSLVALARKPLR